MDLKVFGIYSIFGSISELERIQTSLPQISNLRGGTWPSIPGAFLWKFWTLKPRGLFEKYLQKKQKQFRHFLKNKFFKSIYFGRGKMFIGWNLFFWAFWYIIPLYLALSTSSISLFSFLFLKNRKTAFKRKLIGAQ